MGRRLRALPALAGVLALGAGASLACFSKHDAATAPTGGECSLPLGEGVAGSTVVVIRNFTFGPADVRIRPGERVTWLNCDQDQHTSTADGGQWASGLLSPGDAFTQTFPAAGQFTYHCEPHPFMTGRVTVE